MPGHQQCKQIPYGCIDPEIVRLVRALNATDCLTTIGSCIGHGAKPAAEVLFKVTDEAPWTRMRHRILAVSQRLNYANIDLPSGLTHRGRRVRKNQADFAGGKVYLGRERNIDMESLLRDRPNGVSCPQWIRSVTREKAEVDCSDRGGHRGDAVGDGRSTISQCRGGKRDANRPECHQIRANSNFVGH